MDEVTTDLLNRIVYRVFSHINRISHTHTCYTKQTCGTHAVNSINHQSQANLPQADVRAFDADLTSGINHVKRARALFN